MLQTLGGADAFFLIQTKIKRSVNFKRKSALWIVDLHGGDTEIRQQKIEAAGFPCNLINRTEILQLDCQYVLAKAKVCQTLSCLSGLLGIDIGGVHMTFTV